MRPLTGAIITVGAAISLGLLSIGYGYRYQNFNVTAMDANHDRLQPVAVFFRHTDTTLMVMVVALLLTLGIGLALTFVGLGYHHHKRMNELNHLLGRTSTTTTTHAPPT
jgi:ABC-type Na+ efflux pump permease subunit